MQDADRSEPSQGRYVVYGEIASGGMATVEYGRRMGPLGFARPVAIKRPHAHFLKDPSFVAMFVDEARLGARLQHANIVPILDLVDDGGRLALVMEYVHGETLEKLLELARARGEQVPVPIATALIAAVLHGLHAAHEVRADGGTPLGIVHRDVSPQNILVGADGGPRVLDFGIAKGEERMTATPSGQIKGKPLYMPPEQLGAEPIDRRADVYSASVVLWEALAGQELFDAESEAAVMKAVLERAIPPLRTVRPDISEALEAIVHKGLARQPGVRFASAHEMAIALEHEVGIATASQVSAWVQRLAGERLVQRAEKLQRMQASAEAEHAARVVNAAPIEPVVVDPVPSDHASTLRVTRVRALALALAAIGALLLALVLWRATREPERSAEPAAESRSIHVATPKPAAPIEPPPPIAPAPAPAPATQEPQPTKRAATKHKPAADRAEQTSPAHRPSPSASCAQPYTIDAQGIRHPKPECL
jgi:serine/threonine-protein kinase